MTLGDPMENIAFVPPILLGLVFIGWLIWERRKASTEEKKDDFQDTDVA